MTQIKTWILLSALSGGRLSLRQQCDSSLRRYLCSVCLVDNLHGVWKYRSQMVNVCFTRCEHFNVLSSICASWTHSDQNKFNAQLKGFILYSGGSWMILTLQHMYNRTCSINRSSFFTTIRLHSTEVYIYLSLSLIFDVLFLSWSLEPFFFLVFKLTVIIGLILTSSRTL